MAIRNTAQVTNIAARSAVHSGRGHETVETQPDGWQKRCGYGDERHEQADHPAEHHRNCCYRQEEEEEIARMAAFPEVDEEHSEGDRRGSGCDQEPRAGSESQLCGGFSQMLSPPGGGVVAFPLYCPLRKT